MKVIRVILQHGITYTGMSATAERGMVKRIMRLYEGYGDIYIPRISGS